MLASFARDDSVGILQWGRSAYHAVDSALWFATDQTQPGQCQSRLGFGTMYNVQCTICIASPPLLSW